MRSFSFACVVSFLLFGQAFCHQTGDDRKEHHLIRGVRADGSVKNVQTHDPAGDSDRMAMSVGADADQSMEEEEASSDDNALQYLMGSRVHDILMEVEDMVRHSSDSKTVPLDKLKVIKDLVKDVLLPDLEARRKAIADQLVEKKLAIEVCNANTATKTQNISVTTASNVTEARTNHSTCREGEKTKNTTKGTDCKILNDWLGGIVAPTVMPNPKTRDGMVQYVKTMSTYFCPKGPEVETMDKKCNDASNAHASHKMLCDAAQSTFESFFCQWRTQLTDACTTFDTCYNQALGSFNQLKTHTLNNSSKTLRVEFAAMQKIICFVDVWLGDGTVTTVNESKFDACKAGTIDTSSMAISIPAVPDKATCSLAAVQKYPGTDGFKTEYASFQDYVVPTVPCLPR